MIVRKFLRIIAQKGCREKISQLWIPHERGNYNKEEIAASSRRERDSSQ